MRVICEATLLGTCLGLVAWTVGDIILPSYDAFWQGKCSKTRLEAKEMQQLMQLYQLWRSIPDKHTTTVTVTLNVLLMH